MFTINVQPCTTRITEIRMFDEILKIDKIIDRNKCLVVDKSD